MNSLRRSLFVDNIVRRFTAFSANIFSPQVFRPSLRSKDFGNAPFRGGNNYPAKEAVPTLSEVRDPNETKRVIEVMVACRRKSERRRCPNLRCVGSG